MIKSEEQKIVPINREVDITDDEATIDCLIDWDLSNFKMVDDWIKAIANEDGAMCACVDYIDIVVGDGIYNFKELEVDDVLTQILADLMTLDPKKRKLNHSPNVEWHVGELDEGMEYEDEESKEFYKANYGYVIISDSINVQWNNDENEMTIFINSEKG